MQTFLFAEVVMAEVSRQLCVARRVARTVAPQLGPIR